MTHAPNRLYFEVGDFVDPNNRFTFIEEVSSKDANHRKIKVKDIYTQEEFVSYLSDLRTGHTKYPPSLRKKMRNENRRVWTEGEEKEICGNNIVLLGDAGYRSKIRMYYFENLNTGHIFKDSVTHVLSGCNLGIKGLSKGEQKVSSILQEMKINFVSQKTFNDCRSDSDVLLRFDFYLPDYNCCIEYDGEQHFVGWRKATNTCDTLERIQQRDKIKDEYCVKNEIRMIRIPYTDYDVLTKEYLEEKLNNL